MAGSIPEAYRLDPGPMRDWLMERAYAFELNEGAVSADALGAGVHLTPHQRLLRLLDWEGDTGVRRLHRWLNEADVIDRRDVEEALFTAGVEFGDVYPEETPADGRRRDFGRSYVCTEEVLVAAHTMHMEGLSARQVARELFADCFSASPHALAASFLNAWHARGWEVRQKGEATALKNRQRAVRPFCQHVHKLGVKRDERCERRCVGNDQWCWKHNPDRITTTIARLRQVTPPPAAVTGSTSESAMRRRKRWCTGCKVEKPWVEFWAAAVWPDGSMRRPQARCRDCVKARLRERRRENPEAARERDRRNRAKLQSDPEKAQQRRETQRENSTTHRRRNGAQPWDEYVESRRAA